MSDLIPAGVTPETLAPVNYASQRVVTTATLGELYGTAEKNLQMNFSRNADRFIEGKHYFKLEGEALRQFKHRVSESYSADGPCDSSGLEHRPTLSGSVTIAPNVNSLMLWTERGAARHAKLLDTDQAWEVFERMEDSYFDDRSQTARRQIEQLHKTKVDLEWRMGMQDRQIRALTNEKIALMADKIKLLEARIKPKPRPATTQEIEEIWQLHSAGKPIPDIAAMKDRSVNSIRHILRKRRDQFDLFDE